MPRVQESHHPCTLRTHCTIRIRVGENPGVMVHLHTPIRPSIRHLQESSVLKEADYLEEEEEEVASAKILKTNFNFIIANVKL